MVPRVGRLALISYFQKPDTTVISEELDKVAGSGKSRREAEQNLEDKKEDQVTSMFFIDLHFFALRDACWLGDEKLCELTFGKFVAAP
jgi:hypothetical protein